MLRHTKTSDLDQIMDIINDSKAYFLKSGIDQWQNGYPNEDTFINDISLLESYVYVIDGLIIATLMISFLEEPTYAKIAGNWSLEAPYATIHRIAVSSHHKGQGYAKAALKAAEALIIAKGINQIRIDTHKDNLVMINYLESSDFKYCGVIELSDGNKRNAYDKILI